MIGTTDSEEVVNEPFVRAVNVEGVVVVDDEDVGAEAEVAS